MWPCEDFNEMRDFFNSICNNTISDDDYKRYLDWCKQTKSIPIQRGQKAVRNLGEKWKIEDDLLWEAKLEIKKKKEEALKNKYKF